MSRLRVVVADDHPVMRDGLARSLAALDVEVVGSVGDGRSAVAAVERTRPDVVLMDVAMPAMDGIRASEIIRARHPEVTVVVLTFDGGEEIQRRARAAGAAEVLTKDTSAEGIVAAIRSAAGVAPPAADPGRGAVLQLGAAARPAAGPRPAGGELSLTKRELEVLAMIARGASTPRVAAELYISAKTVKNHLASIYEKLDVADRTQAVVRGLRLGLVSLDAG